MDDGVNWNSVIGCRSTNERGTRLGHEISLLERTLPAVAGTGVNGFKCILFFCSDEEHSFVLLCRAEGLNTTRYIRMVEQRYCSVK